MKDAFKVFCITGLSIILMLEGRLAYQSVPVQIYQAIAATVLFYIVVEYVISRWRNP